MLKDMLSSQISDFLKKMFLTIKEELRLSVGKVHYHSRSYIYLAPEMV